MRLLICRICKTMDELPDFSGDGTDVMLEELVAKHNRGNYTEHQQEGTAKLISLNDEHGNPISAEAWDKNRDQIVKRINGEIKSTGFDDWAYEARNTYAEDALKCYSSHGRPKAGCIDWWDDSKRIGRPTAEGRSTIKESPGLGTNDPHLCQWCPVASYVRTEVNFRKGLYK